MFEPIHGSAFDIMGKGLANPVGTFCSVVMLLEHPGETEVAGGITQLAWRARASGTIPSHPGAALTVGNQIGPRSSF